MGGHSSSITYYEGEATNPNIHFTEQVAKALGVSKALLLGLDLKTEVLPSTPSVIKLLRGRVVKLSSLPKNDQEAIVSVLDGFFFKNKITV